MTRVTIKRQRAILSDFKRGLSMVGIARKYGIKRNVVEQIIRHWMNK